MPRSTFGALVNWMFEYSMISSRLPQGSRKSRNGPSTITAPAAFGQFDDARAVIDDEADMALLDPLAPGARAAGSG